MLCFQQEKEFPHKKECMIIYLIFIIFLCQYLSSSTSTSSLGGLIFIKAEQTRVNKRQQDDSSFIYPTYTSELYAGRTDFSSSMDIFFKQMIPSQVDSRIIYMSSKLTNSIYQYNDTDKSLQQILQGSYIEGEDTLVNGDLLMVEKEEVNSMQYDCLYYNIESRMWKYSMRDRTSSRLTVYGLEQVPKLGVNRPFGFLDWGMKNRVYGVVEGKLFHVEREYNLTWNFTQVKELDLENTQWEGLAMHKNSEIMYLIANRTIFMVDMSKDLFIKKLQTHESPKIPFAVYHDGQDEYLYFTANYDSILVKCPTKECDSALPIYTRDEMIRSGWKILSIPSAFAITKDVFLFNSYFPRRDDITHLALYSMMDNVAYPIYSMDGPIWNGVNALNSSIFPTGKFTNFCQITINIQR